MRTTLLPVVYLVQRKAGNPAERSYGCASLNTALSWKAMTRRHVLGRPFSVTAEGTASATLTGKTTAGADVEIIGSLAARWNSTMDAAWIEPSFSGSIFATATVSPAIPTAIKEVTISPSSATLHKRQHNDKETFRATGEARSYTWSISVGVGTIDRTSDRGTTFCHQQRQRLLAYRHFRQLQRHRLHLLPMERAPAKPKARLLDARPNPKSATPLPELYPSSTTRKPWTRRTCC